VGVNRKKIGGESHLSHIFMSMVVYSECAIIKSSDFRNYLI